VKILAAREGLYAFRKKTPRPRGAWDGAPRTRRETILGRDPTLVELETHLLQLGDEAAQEGFQVAGELV
jgi:hypothetical protein